jgi:hypothetical protein
MKSEIKEILVVIKLTTNHASLNITTILISFHWFALMLQRETTVSPTKRGGTNGLLNIWNKK